MSEEKEKPDPRHLFIRVYTELADKAYLQEIYKRSGDGAVVYPYQVALAESFEKRVQAAIKSVDDLMAVERAKQ
jgi:hypothetical protein